MGQISSTEIFNSPHKYIIDDNEQDLRHRARPRANKVPIAVRIKKYNELKNKRMYRSGAAHSVEPANDSKPKRNSDDAHERESLGTCSNDATRETPQQNRKRYEITRNDSVNILPNQRLDILNHLLETYEKDFMRARQESPGDDDHPTYHPDIITRRLNCYINNIPEMHYQKHGVYPSLVEELKEKVAHRKKLQETNGDENSEEEPEEAAREELLLETIKNKMRPAKPAVPKIDFDRFDAPRKKFSWVQGQDRKWHKVEYERF